MSKDEKFLQRWSRLKQASDEEDQASIPPVPQDAPKAAPTEEKKEPLDLSKLPSVDSLTRDSDYTVFMQPGVPDDLRAKALRRLWQTSPELAGPDLMDMHAFDYTGVDGPRPLVAPALNALGAIARSVVESHGTKTAGADSGSPKSQATDSAGETHSDKRDEKAPENGRG
jgi:hypothetical protein